MECRALERAGIETHVFEPDLATMDAMGVNALDRGRSKQVLSSSLLGAGERIAADESLHRVLGERHAPVA
jgi:hypothetical protein